MQVSSLPAHGESPLWMTRKIGLEGRPFRCWDFQRNPKGSVSQVFGLDSFPCKSEADCTLNPPPTKRNCDGNDCPPPSLQNEGSNPKTII